jgi:hypothetical protein
MTESEWLACAEPEKMLDVLNQQRACRKLRLFALACCRRHWDVLSRDVRHALEVAERFVDDSASASDLDGAWQVALHSGSDRNVQALWIAAWDAATNTRPPHAAAADVVRMSLSIARQPVERSHRELSMPSDMLFEAREAVTKPKKMGLCKLLREIAGNPLRPITLNPTWGTPTVTGLALAIDEEQRFEDLPVLADALEEAGCTDTEILTHLRGPGPHVRGCWVIDLLLGKQ